jgi:hypothetical protein
MENNRRFFEIMARVDEWAAVASCRDCREDAAAEVHYLLNARSEEFGHWTNEEIFEFACDAWTFAE